MEKQLTPDQYEICIKHGTEPPFTGKYNDTKLEGIFKCTCCNENYSHLMQNLIQVQDGQVSGNQFQKKR